MEKNSRILEGLNTCLADETALLQCVVEDGLSLVVNSRTVRLDIPVGRYADGLAISTQSDNAGVSILAGILTDGVNEGTSQSSTDVLYVSLLIQCYYIVTTTK